MSTGKFNEVATQGTTADIAIARSESTATNKFTAADIATDCPARLQEIGRDITERLEQAREQAKRLDANVIAVNKLISEAKNLCDVGGFNKFRELFCPQLGKSQSYVLRAIAAGKTTLADHRAAERERRQRTRANQKAKAANSGTVPEKSKPLDDPAGAGLVEPRCIGAGQTPEPAKPRSAVAPADDAQRAFTVRVTELDRSMAGQPPQHFAATAVPVDVLARLGNLLTRIANLKKFNADGAH